MVPGSQEKQKTHYPSRLKVGFHTKLSDSWLELSFFCTLQWDISQDPPKHRDSGTLTLGLLLRPEGLTSVLELGPEADQPEVRSPRV